MEEIHVYIEGGDALGDVRQYHWLKNKAFAHEFVVLGNLSIEPLSGVNQWV